MLGDGEQVLEDEASMSEIPQPRLWECDVCGKQGHWDDNWRSKLILHKGRIPWDEQIVVCSDKCAEAYDNQSDLPATKE